MEKQQESRSEPLASEIYAVPNKAAAYFAHIVKH